MATGVEVRTWQDREVLYSQSRVSSCSEFKEGPEDVRKAKGACPKNFWKN